METGRTDRFVQDCFGLLIHWGIYAVAAGYECVKNREHFRDENDTLYIDTALINV